MVYAEFESTDVATQVVDAYINSAVGTSDFAANWMLVALNLHTHVITMNLSIKIHVW